MNYTIESGFLSDDNLEVILWAEGMLQDFIEKNDKRLGLNNCSRKERSIIKILCKSFFLDYIENMNKCFIEKTEDTRNPFLTLKDFITPQKMFKHFNARKKYFYDNSKDFPKVFRGYKGAIRANVPAMSRKITNKQLNAIGREKAEIDQNECSEYIKKNLVIQQHEEKDDYSPQYTKKSLLKPIELEVEIEVEKEKEVVKENNPSPGKKPTGKTSQELKDDDDEDQALWEEQEEEMIEKSSLEYLDDLPHPIKKNKFKKVSWRHTIREDISRLPSVNHILFIVIEQEEEKGFLSLFDKKNLPLRLKYIKNLGAFIICDNELIAKDWYHELSQSYYVYPLKSIPKDIKVDSLRGELCFMEGVRPQKTTVVAERFIKRHLGFIR